MRKVIGIAIIVVGIFFGAQGLEAAQAPQVEAPAQTAPVTATVEVAPVATPAPVAEATPAAPVAEVAPTGTLTVKAGRHLRPAR